ncbi:MAG: hypothetical protein ACOYJB_10710 [Christensenellaceae bacterium]|jgi:CBS domain containing-hemolysin-like protein
MKAIKHWTIKIFFITLIISAGVSVAVEYFIGELSLVAAIGVLAAIIFVGILFDIIGVAFSSCSEEPFIAMSAKKDERAHHALKLLKNADIVANFCNDVIGDICGIVSGAAGAAIALKALVMNAELSEMAVSIAVSAIIAACTVAGKAQGKSFAFKKNKDIVMMIGSIANFFSMKKKNKPGKS